MLWFRTHTRPRRQLSSYIDGQLSQKERQELEAHLADCPACQRELAELRATVEALRGLPLAESPRSFILGREHVAAPPRPSAVAGLALPMRLAGAAMAAALAFVLVIDLADLGGDGQTEVAVPTLERAAPAAADLEAAPEARAAAPAEEEAKEALPATAPSPALPATGPAAEGELVPVAGEPGFAEPAAPAPPEDEGGIDALRAAEIALATGLGIAVVLSFVILMSIRKTLRRF